MMEKDEKKRYQVTEWCRDLWKDHIPEGGFCIDATAGGGYDTAYLAAAVGDGGRVLAFDIQEEALVKTAGRLRKEGLSDRVRLILDSHADMEKYTEGRSADLIVFNLGYFPGGDHSVATRPESTIAALRAALRIVKKDGLVSVCIYSGKDSGYQERDAVLDYLKTLDSRKYLVILNCYYNRPNDPPIPVMIYRLTEKE